MPDAVGTRHVVGMGAAWRINLVNAKLGGAEEIVTYAVLEPTTSAAHNAMWSHLALETQIAAYPVESASAESPL